MRIGELIKEYCESHGMSYQKFADSCGVSKGYVSMLIKGVNNKTGRPPDGRCWRSVCCLRAVKEKT